MRRCHPIPALCYVYRPPDNPLKALQIYKQLYRGLKSLRQFNPHIRIYLIAFGLDKELEKVIQSFDITVKRAKTLDKSNYPFIHKLLFLTYLKEEDFDSLLYVDSDTYFFSCPQKIV